jgi:hypothetical protein
MKAITDIFNTGISGFFSFLLNSFLTIIDFTLQDIVKVSFHSETYMASDLGMNFGSLFTVINAFGYYLIVLKLLMKGFNIYVLWTEGDADMDPFMLATGFFKAIIVAVSFNTLYTYMINIAMDISTKLLDSFNNVDLGSSTVIKVINDLSAVSFGFTILAIVYFVCYINLWLGFIRRGLELFILRLGISFACTGLMDSDGGVFKPYIKKFLQELITIILQVVMFKMSVALMLNMHVFFGIAAITMALKAPSFLQEFIMAYGSGQGVTTKVSQTAYAAKMIYSFVK